MLQMRGVPHADDDAAARTSRRTTASSTATPARTATTLDPAAMRAHYRAEGLSEQDLEPGPFAQFALWFAQAAASGLHEPNAMVVSTADGGAVPAPAPCC